MNRLPTSPNVTPTPLFNPSLDALLYVYDKKTYTLAPFAIASFPKYLADRMANRLADEIIAKQGVRKNHQLDKEELLERIYVK